PLPATVEEVVLTGSVSRGVADDVSDIEMLIVTRDQLDLDDCFSLAAAAGLTGLDTWGRQGVPTKRVSGYRDGVPIELIWWSRAHAESAVDAVFTGEVSSTADALANGLALRTSGLLAQWQERLRDYPDELAAERIEEALTDPDPLRAVVVMTELQADTVALAPDGPNIVRARAWLRDAIAILERRQQGSGQSRRPERREPAGSDK